MIEHTEAEIKAKFEEIYPYSSIRVTTTPKQKAHKGKVPVEQYTVDISRDGSSLGIRYQDLFALAEFFGTMNINEEVTFSAGGGCPTCGPDYTNDLEFTIRP
jgi:hypothetical protein